MRKTNPTTSLASDGRRPPLLNRNFLVLVICHFLQALGWSSMLLLPKYFQHLGESGESIGVLMAAASFGGLAVRPLIGWALDCYGKRLVLTFGSILLAIGMFTLSVQSPSYATLLVARVFVGIGAGTLFTGYFSFVADHIPKERRTEGLALFGISGILPMALNAVTESWSTAPSLVQELFPWLTVPILLSGALIWKVPETNRDTLTSSPTVPFHMGMLINRSLLPVWVATLTFSTQVAAFMAFATLCAPGGQEEHAQQIWFYYAIGAVSIRLFAARLPDLLGAHNFVGPSLAAYSIGFILLAEGGSQTQYYLAGICAGVGHGYCFPVLTSQVISRITVQATSRGLALFTALWEVTSLVATAPLGAYADAMGLETMCGLIAVLTTLSLVLWVTLEYHAQRPRKQKLLPSTPHHS
ncbi:MAG: MFS transporter [Bradymonadia bacterium]